MHCLMSDDVLPVDFPEPEGLNVAARGLDDQWLVEHGPTQAVLADAAPDLQAPVA